MAHLMTKLIWKEAGSLQGFQVHQSEAENV